MKVTKKKITINKKMLNGIAPAIAITAVLLAKNNPAVIILWIGIVLGIIINREM
jgi:hypothetical protein